MRPLWPVFIPSKGRPDCKLPGTLPKSMLVIEPQDLKSYKAAGQKNLITLPKDNQGLAYARNFILANARMGGVGWFWMLDDDISGFYRTKDRKLVKGSAGEILQEAQEIILMAGSHVGQAALEYKQFAWASTQPFRLNGYCDVCVAIQTERTQSIHYDATLVPKEDRNFTLSVLSNGLRTLRCSQLSFGAPKNGSNAGGLKSLYEQKTIEVEAVDRMVERWGEDICKAQIKRDGRYDLKINWKFFK